ncbi:MAG: undecaprenyl-diphosphate phosphatase [bacterium]
MREILDVLFLAVLQGVAEFLPVSSSGHLVIAQSLLKINSAGMWLEVVLHLGTMVSIVLYYRKTLLALIRGLLRGDHASWGTAGHVALSAIPAVLFFLLCKDKVEAFFENPHAIGGFLIFTGVVLCALRWMRCGEGGVTAQRALLIGLAQAAAILPGISRSGMTISAARMTGMAPDQAAEFSFLMCLPLLAGAALIGVVDASAQACALPWWLLLTGAAVSAAVGFLSLSLLVRTLRGNRFWLFGPYCLTVGVLTVLFI